MNEWDQTRMVAQAAIFLLPMGVYFLLLGLLSTRPTTMLCGRRDFQQLGLIFLPVLAAVLVWLREPFGWAGVAVGGILAGALWWALLPPQGESFVIYNLPAGRFERLLHSAARACRLDVVSVSPSVWRVLPEVTIETSGFALLGTVSLTCRITPSGEQAHDDQTRATLHELLDQLQRRCHQYSTWPTMGGAALVVAGCGLLCVPLMLFAGHLPAVAEVVRQLAG